MAKTEVTAAANPPELNLSELRRFLDTFAPVVAALPAVINAAEHQAELKRHVVILEGQRDAVMAEADQIKANLADSVAKSRQTLQDLEKERQQAISDLKAFKSQAEADKKALSAAVEDARSASAAQIQLHVAAAATAESEKMGRIAAVEASIAATLAAGNAVIDEVDKKRASAEKALEKLREKLGA